MYNTALELYNIWCWKKYNTDAKRSIKTPEYDPATLILDENAYSEWYKEKPGDEKKRKEKD